MKNNLLGKVFESISLYLESKGWKRIENWTDDFGQWLHPQNGRSHDLDYAFTICLIEEQCKKSLTSIKKNL